MATRKYEYGYACARPHHARALALCIAASVMLHAVVLLGFPQMAKRDAGRVEVLQVTLEKTQPRVLPPAPAPEPRRERLAATKAERLRPEKARRTIPPPARPQPPSPPAVQLPVLAIPSQQNVPEASFTVAAPAPRAAPESQPTPPVPPREPARAAPAVSAEPAEKVMPPSFNAAYLRNPPPRYPVSARRNGEQGTVTLRVFVTREGLPGNVAVQTTSGSRSLDQAAVEAVKGWRFAPARQGAQTVEAWVLVPIVFKLEGVS